MKKLVSLVFLTIILLFGDITLGQPLLLEPTKEEPTSYWDLNPGQQGGEGWNGYTTPQPQQDIVVPISPEYSDSPEAQKLKKQQEEAEQQQQQQQQQECKDGCCGIKLNTNFPGIGKCIPYNKDGTNPTNVFKVTMTTLTKLIMSIILVICFILIIVAGIMWAADKPKEGRELIKKVAITILLLGFSGVILRLINPNFFG